MKYELTTETELRELIDDWSAPPEDGDNRTADRKLKPAPTVLTVDDLLELDVPAPEMLIENLQPKCGASLIVGASKSGKTILAVQKALAVATGRPLFDHYKVLTQGAALIIEQDDPAGEATIKNIIQSAGVKSGTPLYVVPRVPFSFGTEFFEWLEGQITKRSLRFVALDSYTALRGSRGGRADIVKAEQTDMTLLDALGKRTGCAIDVIHHYSKGSASLDWSQKAAGTFAMSAATEGQMHVSRFPQLDSASPERLVRVRGRHLADVEMVLRFRAETLDYAHLLAGGAAPLFPLLLQIRSAFGQESFGPRELSHETGVSRATASRHIDQLHRTGALVRRGYGEYALKCDETERYGR
jgi:hypothetical protein